MYRPAVKKPVNEAQEAKDLARVPTPDLYDMLETNLRVLILAWEGNMSTREKERRTRLCLAITKEVRSRGVQMSLGLLA